MILLDTHTFVWLFHEPVRLTEPVLDTLEQTDVWNVATISLWEIAMLFQKRRLRLNSPLSVWLKKHDGSTQLRRLQSDELQSWLDKYTLGQLWTRGEIGGTRW